MEREARRSRPARSRLLRRGENCSAVARAERFRLLVDAAAYFDAFRRAAERAERRIVILAWDFDSRTPIAWDDEAASLRLGEFLNSLAGRRRRLEIFVLDWDYPLLFGLERETRPIYGLGWKAHRRVRIRYDGGVPLGASQHQKVVVIDDRLAFVGGLDLAARRWDTPEHDPGDPRRVWQRERYPPFHDVMALLDGQAARELARIACRRWGRATGRLLPAVEVEGDPWPPGLRPDLEDVLVGIACTAPGTDDEAATREIERLYLDLIGRARRYIYFENQYFTAQRIAEALAARLAAPQGPEVVLVTRLRSQGWLEEVTMHGRRARLIDALRAADRHGRFHAFYPHLPGLPAGNALEVHSKLAIVDDEWLRVGSANLSNRSMRLDTECDVVVDAEGRAAVAAAIRAARNRIVAEHLDVRPSEVEAQARRTGSLAGAIARLRSERRSLRALETERKWPDALVDVATASADPERPVSLDTMVAQFGPELRAPQRRVPVKLLLAAAAVAALVAAYWLSPFAELADVDETARRVDAAAGRWWLAPLLVAAYTPGSFLLFPRSVITVSAAIALGPGLAFVCAVAGSLIAASAGYAGGRRFPRDAVRRIAGARLNALSHQLRRQGLLALCAIRLVPLGPFAIQNVVAGAVGVRLPRFLVATLVGILPGTLVSTFLGDQLRLVLLQGGKLDLPLLVALAVGFLLCAALARLALVRTYRRSAAGERAGA